MDIQNNAATINDIRELMAINKIILVHFSTLPRMSHHPELWYPNDIEDAIGNRDKFNLCYSSISPSSHQENFPGYIGIILDPSDATSLIDFSSGDGGSYTIPGSYDRVSEGKKITRELLEEEFSINTSTSYSEGHIVNYNVVGIFVSEPINVATKPETIKIDYDNLIDSDIEHLQGWKRIDINQVARKFNNLRIYKIIRGAFYRFDNNSWNSVSYEDIYPWGRNI